MFDDAAKALAYIETAPIPTVIKADGLALGKGVIIAMTREEAADAVRSIMEDKQFGDSGNQIVIEEFLEGPEVSVLSFTDGKTVVPMISSMDHKRALDGDKGLNTGGMGTIAPNPYYTPEVAERCMKEIFLPTINAMNAEGRTFKGCLYFGLMITKNGPKVIEYNCRFGDPETQVVLPLLESDLFEIMKHVAAGTLADAEVKFSSNSACCVVMASEDILRNIRRALKSQCPQIKISISQAQSLTEISSLRAAAEFSALPKQPQLSAKQSKKPTKQLNRLILKMPFIARISARKQWRSDELWYTEPMSRRKRVSITKHSPLRTSLFLFSEFPLLKTSESSTDTTLRVLKKSF